MSDIIFSTSDIVFPTSNVVFAEIYNGARLRLKYHTARNTQHPISAILQNRCGFPTKMQHIDLSRQHNTVRISEVPCPMLVYISVKTIGLFCGLVIKKAKTDDIFCRSVCRYLGSAYLCRVFFIVLDLRLTRLGYGGTPFFLPFSARKWRKFHLRYGIKKKRHHGFHAA